jgi:peroxiredoxin
VLIAGLLVALPGCTGGARPPRIGTQAPEFVVSYGAQTVSPSQFRGKTLVLNFWATWCPPCVEEMPSLVQLQHKLKDKNVTVLGVSVDADDAAYKRFIQDHGIDFPTIRDGDHKSTDLYGTFKFPETYIIDKNGIVRRKFIGAVDWTSPEVIDFLTKL